MRAMRKSSWARTCTCLVLVVVLLGVDVTRAVAQGSVFDDPGKAAAVCGAGGAAVGAAIGSAIGGRRGGAGALLGGLAGALLGGAIAAAACFKIAEYRNAEVKSYDETRRETQYNPSQGDVVQVTYYKLTPAAVAPGGAVEFGGTYYVMTPNPEQEVNVIETRVIERLDTETGTRKELGKFAGAVTIKPGTREASGKFPIDSGVAEGRYWITLSVAKNGISDTKTLELLVTKDEAALGRLGDRVAQVGSPGTKAATLSEPARTEARPPEGERQARGHPQGESAGTEVKPSEGQTKPAAGERLAALGEQKPQSPEKETKLAAGERLAALGEQKPQPPGEETKAADAKRAAPASTPQVYFVAVRVVGRGASVREGPGTKHKVIALIPSGDRHLIVERTPKGDTKAWTKIQLDDGREGWVLSELGDEVPE